MAGGYLCQWICRQPNIMLMELVILNGKSLALAQIEAVSLANCRVEIAPEARARMAASRATIEQILDAGQTVYGVNTGFGKLSDVRIST